MKKKAATLAIAMIALFGVAANAQEAPQNKMYQPREFTEWAFEGILLDINQQAKIDSLNSAVKANCPMKNASECQASQQCPKGDNTTCAKDGKQCKKGDNATCAKDGKQCPKGDNATCAKEGKQCKKGDNATCAKDGKQCTKGDNATCAKDGKQCKKGDRKEMKRGVNGPVRGCPYGEDYIIAVKDILTPDQYVVFLENIVSKQPQNGPVMQQKKMQPQRGKKGQAQMRNNPQKLDNQKKAKATVK